MKAQENQYDERIDAVHSAPPSKHHSEIDEISIECYENHIPAYVGTQLDKIYGSVFSSLLHLRLSGTISTDTCTYIVRSGERINTVLLFRRESDSVRVLNRGIVIGDDEISRFCDYIFKAYKSVRVVIFQSITTRLNRTTYPHKSAGCPAEVVIELPKSSEEYLASIGKNTRRNIRRYMDRLLRTFPSFRMNFYSGEIADEKQIREIIQFNKVRTIEKKEAYYRSEDEIQRIISLTRKYGVVGLATINDAICGGTIGYKVGDNFIYAIISHDPQYNDYWIGMLSSYLTICESIKRGCKQFNFMSGHNDYKRLLGAQLRDTQRLALYRSRMDMLLKAGTALTFMCSDLTHKFNFASQEKLYALQRAAKNGDLDSRSRLLFYALNTLRGFRRFLSKVSVSLK